MIAYGLTTQNFRTPHGRPVSITYRHDTNDYNTVFSTLDMDEYKLPKGLTGTAVDVGGYLGTVGIALAMDNLDLRVVIVEPVPPNAELCRVNVANNDVGDRVEVHEAAVGKGGEVVEVWYGYRGSESLEHHAFVGNSTLAYDEMVIGHESVIYSGISLASLVKEYGPLSFVKIDTEGAEWAFLDSPAVKDVETFVGEWHPVRDHTQGDMLALLDKTHVVTFDGPQAGPGGFRAVRR